MLWEVTPISVPREAPPEFAAALRDIDPTAVIVCLGHTVWQLGRVRYDRGVAVKATRQLDEIMTELRKAQGRLRMGPKGIRRMRSLTLSAAFGFRPVEEYEVTTDLCATDILQDYARIAYAYRHGKDDQWVKEEKLRDRKQRDDMAWVHDPAGHKDVYRQLFAKPHSVVAHATPLSPFAPSGRTRHRPEGVIHAA